MIRGVRFHPSALRVRLTLWYVLLLGLTLLLFSGYLYLRLEQSLQDQLDASLQTTAAQVYGDISTDNIKLAFNGSVESQATAHRLSQAGFLVRIVALDGTVRDGFGSYKDLPRWKPTGTEYARLEDEDVSWRAYSRPILDDKKQVIGWLQVAQSLSTTEAASDSLLQQLLIGVPLALFLTGAGGLFLADRALRPIDQITRTAQAIRGGVLDQRINYRGPDDELGRLAATLDHMLDRLEATFEREHRFTADVAHELRTPLSALKGQIEVALGRPRTGEEYESTLKTLAQDVERLIRLSTDLLLLTRLDQGHLRWQPEVIDLSDLLAAVVGSMEPLAEGQKITLETDLQPSLQVYGDLDQLMRLCLNVLDNAIKYTPSGGQVMIQAVGTGTEIRVLVCDTGLGIEPQHLAHLFERFYRVEADRSRAVGGAGLGLAIAHEIVVSHGGSIEVHSKVGKGTTLTLRFPADSPEVRHQLEAHRR